MQIKELSMSVDEIKKEIDELKLIITKQEAGIVELEKTLLDKKLLLEVNKKILNSLLVKNQIKKLQPSVMKINNMQECDFKIKNVEMKINEINREMKVMIDVVSNFEKQGKPWLIAETDKICKKLNVRSLDPSYVSIYVDEDSNEKEYIMMITGLVTSIDYIFRLKNVIKSKREILEGEKIILEDLKTRKEDL